MHCSGLKGEGALMESTLLALAPVTVARARHDLQTLAGLLPADVTDPLGQLQALGDRVAAAFTTPREWEEDDDPALLDVGRVLLERHGDELLVAGVVAAIGQSAGWPVAVVASERRAFVAHRRCGPPLALSIADEGRLIDTSDLSGEGDLWWRCPHEVADALAAKLP